MILNYINGHPLAMLPSKVDEIMTFLQNREDGFKLEIDKDKYPAEENLSIINGIATLNIFGSISRRMNMMQKMSGGVSIEQLQSTLVELENNEQVRGVLLFIDSPGSSVHGVKSLSDFIFDMKTPIIAYSDGIMASGAYWIASACDLVICSETSTVGSIGVVTVHTDQSKSNETAGIKNTVMFSGKYKALGNPEEPLNDESRMEIQEKLDQYYSIFVENVAGNRGYTVEAIQSVAEGKTYIGKNAPIELIDLKGSIELAYSSLNNMINEENKNMTLEEFKALEHFSTVKAEIEVEAVNAERARCEAIFSIEGGHEDVKLAAIKEGKNIDAVYASLYHAEIASKKNELDRLAQITQPVATATDVPAKTSSDVSAKDYNDLVARYVKEGNVKSKAMLLARQENPASFAAYLKSVN